MMKPWGFWRACLTFSATKKNKEEKKMSKTKKPVFGQLTLTGDLALDWMKNGTEMVVAQVDIGPIGAFGQYNVPDWAQEKTGEIAILHHPSKGLNPVLVTQRSILRLLEHWCVEKEMNGATTSVETGTARVKFGRLDLNDAPAKLRFDRDESKGQFAPYVMEEL
tara:strand:+ start:420 stop:911 length:492 start_codon:yes stop_codon:yes gene_type:complete